MRVYYMTSLEIALKYILLEQRMKVSRFADLNDPFELACHDAGNREIRAHSQAFIETANERFGLICFSDSWKSPVMWAHYANKHEGVCLGFDVPIELLGYVQYVESRLMRQGDLPLRVDQFQFIDEMLYHKANEWRYERELRTVVLLGRRRRPMYHVPFGPTLQLCEVVIGAKCNFSPTDLAPFILSQPTSVRILKSRAAFKAFQMVENKRFKSVIVPASNDCHLFHKQARTLPRFIRRAPLADRGL